MQLQKSATGLLSWFQLKVGGRNPTAFGDSVTPVVEVGDNYLQQGETGFDNAVGGVFPVGANAGALVIDTVPAGKTYRLISVAMDVVPAAADAAIGFDWFCYWLLASTGNLGFIASGPMTLTGSAANARFGCFYLPRPLWLPPGANLVFGARSTAVLTVNATQHIYVARSVVDL